MVNLFGISFGCAGGSGGTGGGMTDEEREKLNTLGQKVGEIEQKYGQGGGSFPEAPTDGEAYGRVNGEWGKVLKKPSVEVTEIPVTLTYDDDIGGYVGDKFIDTGEVIVNGERYSCPQGDFMGLTCYGNLSLVGGTGGENVPFLYLDYILLGIPMAIVSTIDIQSFAFVEETKKDLISAEGVDGVIPYLKEGWIDAEIEDIDDSENSYLTYSFPFDYFPEKVIVNGEEWELAKGVYDYTYAGNLNVITNPGLVQEGECLVVIANYGGTYILFSLIEIDSLKVWGNTYTNKITPEVVDDAVYKKAVEFDDKGLEDLFSMLEGTGKFTTNSHDAAIDALFDANDISKDIENRFVSPQLGTMTFSGPPSCRMISIGRSCVIPFQVSGFNVASSLQYLRVAATNVTLGNQLTIVQIGDNVVSLSTPQLNVPPGIYKVFIYDSRNPMLRSDVVTIEVFSGVRLPSLLCSKVVKRTKGGKTFYYITAYTTLFIPSMIDVIWKVGERHITSSSPDIQNTVMRITHREICYILRSTIEVAEDNFSDNVEITLQHYTSPPKGFTIKVK